MENKNYFKINIIYFTALVCTALVFVLGYLEILKSDWISTILIQIVVMFSIPLLLYTLLISKNSKQTFKDVGIRKITIKMLWIAIALGFVLYFLNTFVATTFQSIISLLGYEKLSSPSKVNLNYAFLFKEFLLTAILPGICEEFLHRGVMLFGAKKCCNTKTCLIISSLLFGLTHLNINQFFYAAILGFLMGNVALASNSIIPTMIIHFMNNFLSTYLYYGTHLGFPVARFISTIESLLMSDVITYMITITAGVMILWWLYTILVKSLKKERAKIELNNILKNLNLEENSKEESLKKLNHAENIMQEKINNTPIQKNTFQEKIFLYASIFFGVFMTISSFIWGILWWLKLI